MANETSMLSNLLEANAAKDEVITDEALIAKVTGIAYGGPLIYKYISIYCTHHCYTSRWRGYGIVEVLEVEHY